ncbi:unknown protein 1 [Cornus florida]|uniref:unknown protein 1 n=1 Tax=Cornus florida TaxID=4283 RepID=UPI00289D0F28|nr:unknown protein 1 [Cornus florida]
MDIEASTDLLMKEENHSLKFMNKSDDNCVIVKAKNVKEMQPPSTVICNKGASLGPITPDSNKESADFPLDFSSPRTLVTSLPKAVCFDSHRNVDRYASNSMDDGLRTPKEDVFDPFAPGPDKLMLAPQSNKYLEETRSSVARQLNFGSSVKFVGDENHGNDAEHISDEETLVEAVYRTLLKEIVSKQIEELFAEISALDSVSDGFKTPPSAPRFSGVADTCPGAPMKPTRKSRNIDQGLCRKLEF